MTNTKKLPLHVGGVMRCCIASLDEAEREGSIESKEGAVLQCKYCGDWLRVEKGKWKWWNRQ